MSKDILNLAIVRKNSERKKRRCLKCQRMFRSTWPGHRRCGRCQNALDATPQAVMRAAQARRRLMHVIAD